MELYNNRLLRRIIVPFLSRVNIGDITIRHHYTGDPVQLHSFKHKGYWYHGRNREKETMMLFGRILNPGDTVIEVGGHIGYISLYFKWLVKSGDVYVFESGANNLPYIRRNVCSKGIHLKEMAAGDLNGIQIFFLEELTGQNNTFVRDFKGLQTNAANAFTKDSLVTEVTVEMVRLDDFVDRYSITPNFIKIDVEGFESSVLKGMTGLLGRFVPKIMVEVQANQEEIFQMLAGFGYILFTGELERCLTPRHLRGNIFGFHRSRHRHVIDLLGLDVESLIQVT